MAGLPFKVNVVNQRIQLELAHYCAKYGIAFVVMPTLSKEQYDEAIREANTRLWDMKNEHPQT